MQEFNDYPGDEPTEQMDALLLRYEQLKQGHKPGFFDEESFERIIDHYDDVNDIIAALDAAELGLTYFPYSSILLIKKADLLLATRRYQEALDILERAELFDSNEISLYILKTDAYLALDQPHKAVELLQDALQRFQGEEQVELLFELADVYDDYEDFEKVFDCMAMILEMEPTNEEALYKICFWTDFTGRNEESIRLHQRIIDQHPYNELAWFNLACAYQGLKLHEKAIDAYQYAIAIDEKFDYAYRNMGDAYMRLRKYKEAIEALQRVAELTRPEEVIFEALGHCYEKLGQIAQARFHYRKASHLAPDDSKLHFKIAGTYMAEKQWGTAIRQLEVAMRLHKSQPDFNIAMGTCHQALGQFKEAITYFGVAVRSRPKNVGGWEQLIGCLYDAGYYEEAVVQCRAALVATEGKPVFHFLEANNLFHLLRRKEALLALEKGLELAPKLLKKLLEINPALLQYPAVVDLVARYKKQRRNS